MKKADAHKTWSELNAEVRNLAAGIHLDDRDEELKEQSSQPRDPSSGRFRPLAGAGGDNWVLGKLIQGLVYEEHANKTVVLNERTYALGLLKSHIQALGEM